MKRMLQILNFVMIAIAIVGGLYFAITRDKEIGLILKDSSIVLTITAPYWVEKLFHKKISTMIKFIVVLFIFSAHFLGTTLELYNHIAYFDKVTHTISGVLTALFALLFLKVADLYDKRKIAFNILFLLSFTMLVASGWEMFEYIANIFFGGDAQRVALTGVNDTMQDIIVAFLGAIFIAVCYVFEEKRGKELFVKGFMQGIQ